LCENFISQTAATEMKIILVFHIMLGEFHGRLMNFSDSEVN